MSNTSQHKNPDHCQSNEHLGVSQPTVPNQRKSNRVVSGFVHIAGTRSFSKAIGNVYSTARGSSARIGNLVSSLFARDAEFPSVHPTGNDSERFAASANFHHVSQDRLNRMIRITKRNFNLYFWLVIVATTIGAISLYLYPPTSATAGLFRFVTIPVLGALTFKHAYSNWLFRNRRLASPLVYFKSGDIWPKLQ